LRWLDGAFIISFIVQDVEGDEQSGSSAGFIAALFTVVMFPRWR
jgi:hypothetical protein